MVVGAAVRRCLHGGSLGARYLSDASRAPVPRLVERGATERCDCGIAGGAGMGPDSRRSVRRPHRRYEPHFPGARLVVGVPPPAGDALARLARGLGDPLSPWPLSPG